MKFVVDKLGCIIYYIKKWKPKTAAEGYYRDELLLLYNQMQQYIADEEAT